ncbi:PolC-type DNA polymerase III [Sporolactobacillus sp. CPB3-1]|uniref:DNA polymerase III PolC-type n=1 Tax=Sporolactobacillus mangiferae TaxID=2940498 RepID=A0ABT0M7M3_9BACL|nr:PolC-type DNA polymerase III [Sporolactobacillus mangiferae]MCL1630849.1 PolC-type DNA polymerase III [Sporolactobacillus mangiferae]
MDRASSKSERLRMLLEHIHAPREWIEQYFAQGEIEKLTVYRSEKRWHLDLRMTDILPYKVYEWLETALQKHFQSVVSKVTFSIQAKNTDSKNQYFTDYWQSVVNKQLIEEFPALKLCLKQQHPSLDDQQLVLNASSETEAGLLKRKLPKVLNEKLRIFGFPPFSLYIKINAEDRTKAYDSFVKQREAEDQQKVVQAMIERQKKKEAKEAAEETSDGPLKIGYDIHDEAVSIETIQDEERRLTIQGYVFDSEIRELRSGRTLLLFKITDYTDSLMVKAFSRDKEDAAKFGRLQKGMWVKVRGGIQNDSFVRDLVMIANDIEEIMPDSKQDTAPEGRKRVELHAHTVMSQMDSVVTASALIKRAKQWGHRAIAITDHGVAQSYPEAYAAGKKNGIKILYGVEANLIDDGVPVAYNLAHRDLSDDTYVVFDVETTGLSAVYDTIIEFAAVKMKNGEVLEKFDQFINPHRALPQKIIELTSITDEMLKDAPDEPQVIEAFRAFAGEAILVAHNATFDMGFLNTAYQRLGYDKADNPVIDTLELGRLLYPEFKNHKLDTLCKAFNIELTHHHRAIYDTEATAYVAWKMIKDAGVKGMHLHDQLNDYLGKGNLNRIRPSHIILLVKNQTGLKNLYKLISLAHVKYFYRVPRIPRSLLNKYREGLLVGSGCEKGELFETMMQKSAELAEKVAEFYDYIEIQPPSNYQHLVEKGIVRDELALKDVMIKLVKLGEKMDKPVIAAGDVHYLDEHDKIYRKILIASQAANPLNRQTQPDVHFRTTDEMLEAMRFLGEEKAEQVVIDNPNAIADLIDDVLPVKDKLYTPTIDGAEDEVKDKTYKRAHTLYGDQLPKLVERRLEKELKSIIGHGFSVIYLIAHRLVKKSLSDGYLVGSRGSVGSSLVATMLEITEVNPLPPHYLCPECHHVEFFTDGSVACGFDLPDKKCPECGTIMKKEGHDIPFETFLGFKGDKVPDIDLNFSGDYQPVAHNYTKVLFGEDKVFRAGTIGTIADKTAYGYVKGYEEDTGASFRSAERDRLAAGCTGAKRTTGQHPGGIVVVPRDMEIYDFTPVQYPADDKTAEWKTTHFDFHSIHDNILKLDILGHDDPTVIRMLQDLSGIDPKTIPTDDQEVMKIFSSTESLGVTPEQIRCKTGSLGIPEFGTRFVRQMLEDTKPTSFAELVQISGLSHGTDVWLGNAQVLIEDGTCVLRDVISCRDDIMIDLMHQGLEPSHAFKIMESVRKGKGLTEEWVQEMKANNVPEWYLDSCLKIKYMFPKAHATAYVLMAFRIAYFKVHYPILFYATYFSVRADDFDVDVMKRGSDAIRTKMDEIEKKGNDALPKEKSLLTVLEVALEMCERGLSFQSVDLYRSDATRFLVDGDSLIPPFNAIPGVGTNAAKAIADARKDGEFLSKEDLQRRAKISKTILEYLDVQGCLKGMPDANQLSLF